MTAPSKNPDAKKTTTSNKAKAGKGPSQKKQKAKPPQKGSAGGQVETDQERGRRLVEMALQLVAAQIGPDDRGKLSEASYNDMFDDALRRADRTLALMEGRALPAGEDPEVHAYQLFEEGEILAAKGITDRFNEFEWEGLCSKVPVTKLMEDLRACFDKEQIDMELQSHPLEILDRVKREIPINIRDYLVENGYFGEFPFLEAFVDEMQLATVRAIRQLVIDCGEAVERFSGWHHKSEFREWCFPVWGKERKKIRPHEAFRNAAKRGWFSDRLIRSWSELHIVRMPGPGRTSLAPFELFEQAQSERIKEFLRSVSDSPAASTSPETGLRDPEE